MTSPEASTETWKCSAMPSRVPDGLEEANVALTTINTETVVIYHLRRVDQFLGFSISPGEKSRWPFSLRYGLSVDLMALER